jgi:thioredoxin reductase (NADPH)
MAKAIVIGDGPAGLSAALFLAKNDIETVVYGEDETPMHTAHLFNYLGIDDVDGTNLQERARSQAAELGADLRNGKVVEVGRDGDAFSVRTESGDEDRADYLVLAGGRQLRTLAEQLGVEMVDGAVSVDADNRTTMDRVYAAGRLVRPHRSQAIISAGAGAAAAIDILSREAGRDVTDWDKKQR